MESITPTQGRRLLALALALSISGDALALDYDTTARLEPQVIAGGVSPATVTATDQAFDILAIVRPGTTPIDRVSFRSTDGNFRLPMPLSGVLDNGDEVYRATYTFSPGVFGNATLSAPWGLAEGQFAVEAIGEDEAQSPPFPRLSWGDHPARTAITQTPSPATYDTTRRATPQVIMGGYTPALLDATDDRFDVIAVVREGDTPVEGVTLTRNDGGFALEMSEAGRLDNGDVIFKATILLPGGAYPPGTAFDSLWGGGSSQFTIRVGDQGGTHTHRFPSIRFGYHPEFDGPNEPPAVAFEATPETGEAPLTVSLTATATDPDGVIAAYVWSTSDGQQADGESAAFTFAEPGSYRVTLEVTDDDGASTTAERSIEVEGSSRRTNAAGMTFITLPAGSFMMGSPETYTIGRPSERPQHPVTVPAFRVMTTEVTREQWRAVMGEDFVPEFSEVNLPPDFLKCIADDCPVEGVSWIATQRFIARLNEQSGGNYRLPSEAEWEYAARAGTTTPFWWGSQPIRQPDRANCTDFDCEDGYPDGAAPVGSFPANPWGLHDTSGNVHEWVQDCWLGSYTGAPSDGSAWEGDSCDQRVLRGGSWRVRWHEVRSASRSSLSHDVGLPYSLGVGFRLAQDVDTDDRVNYSPTATIQTDSIPHAAPFTVELDGSGSHDVDGTIASYSWNSSDGQSATGPTATFTFDEPGSVTVTLTVRDNEGTTATDHYSLVVADPGVAGNSVTNAFDMTFVTAPAGTFMMGSPLTETGRNSDEGPRHQVALGAFRIMTTEVTRDQWRAVMGEELPDHTYCGPACPVEGLSWDQVQAFIQRLNARSDGGYRLPSEAEWEYSARAGTITPYWWGNEIQPGMANCSDTACQDAHPIFAPVGSFPANPWGLHDTSGNVWEWVQDCWNEDYTGAPSDGSARESDSCNERVVRGGSWTSSEEIRSAARFKAPVNTDAYSPILNVRGHGFRLAQDLDAGDRATPTTAEILASPNPGTAPLTVELNGGGSHDTDGGTIENY